MVLLQSLGWEFEDVRPNASSVLTRCEMPGKCLLSVSLSLQRKMEGQPQELGGPSQLHRDILLEALPALLTRPRLGVYDITDEMANETLCYLVDRLLRNEKPAHVGVVWGHRFGLSFPLCHQRVLSVESQASSQPAGQSSPGHRALSLRRKASNQNGF